MKYYVIWEWKKKWIFTSRDECKSFVQWVAGAKYKSFKTLQEAEIAIEEWFKKYYSKEKWYEKDIPFQKNSIAVDAACSHNPGKTEYQWVDLVTWEKIFHKSFWEWTNNIWEFLALVHWLSYLKKNDSDKAIYSDSKHAISRVNYWKCKTKMKKTKENWDIFSYVKRAEDWLRNNKIKNAILKRNTKERWEIPADFGRK